VLGAVFVSMLPQVLDHYSGSIPFIAEAGSGGVEPGQAARFAFGAAIVAVLMFAPGGLGSLSTLKERTR
jgi:branched-chain amino acid transport system permease protein